MAILTGTSQTRFTRVDNPGSVENYVARAQELAQDFTEKLVTSFRDTFVEDGAQSVAGASLYDASWSNLKEPTRRKVYSQRAKATVLIKKRMFSTLRSSFDSTFMDEEEKFYLRAVKNLFRRKCDEIAFYENIANLERVYDNTTGFLNIDEILDNYLDSFLDVLSVGFGIGELGGPIDSVAELLGAGSFLQKLETSVQNAGDQVLGAIDEAEPALGIVATTTVDLLKKLQRLRKLNQRSKSNMFTTWIYDEDSADYGGLGPGTGTIELNLISSISAKSTINTAGGGCELTIEDPYRVFVVSESDIEIALRQTLSQKDGLKGALNSNKPWESGDEYRFDDTGTIQLRQAEILDQQLNESRRVRGLSQVNFEFEFGEEDRAFGIIVETGERFYRDTISLISGEQAFSAPERVRALQILQKMESYKALQKKLIDTYHIESEELGPAREKMRKEFLGHCLIQQMDSVHVFLNSQTRDETPLYGSRSDVSPLEFVINPQLKEDQISDELIKQEYEALELDGIPFAMYRSIRNPSFFRGDGNSVFAGLVHSINLSYSGNNGVFSIRVSCKDNMEYLNITRLNTTPSLSQAEGILEDPITPFELKTNSSTGLLANEEYLPLTDENKKRLRYLRFKEGDRIGEKISSEKDLIRDKVILEESKEISVFEDVPGLLYRWKEGILSATLRYSGNAGAGGGGSTIADLYSTYGLFLSDKWYGNMDSADIISILVTGQPHNYSNFLKAALDSGSISSGGSGNNKFHINYLFDILERQQQVNGSFIPAKPEIISPKKTRDAFRAKSELDKVLLRLTNARKLLAEKQAAQRAVSIEGPPRASEDPFSNLEQASIANLEEQIKGLKNQAYNLKSRLPPGVRLNIVGNQAHLDFENEEDIERINKKLRFTLKRKPEAVRFNTDKNYFIVSEKYDSDVDIQAAVLNFKSTPASLFTQKGSEYQTPLQICKEVGQKDDFEFFADPDGNIVFRPPEYNKVPLSLLVKMMDAAKGDKSFLIPPYLLDLFESRIALVENQIELLELQILEKFLMLGKDLGTQNIRLSLYADDSGTNIALDQQTLLYNAGVREDIILRENDASTGQPSQFSIIASSYSDRIKLLARVRNKIADLTGREEVYNDFENADNIELIGVLSELIEEISVYSDKNGGPNAPVNRERVLRDVSKLLSTREYFLKAYAALTKQGKDLLVQGKGETQKLQDLQRNLLSWATSSGPKDIPVFPRFLEDLIENDLQNNDGFRSGRRYIIYDDVIISSSMSINTPEFNRINVQGNSDLVGTAFSTDPRARFFWAGAVDFDSWRQFGHRSAGSISRPDFIDAETQCAPYAVYKLLRQRKNIHRGTITVMGNEFYRPGDVVYVNYKSMLYYVETVNHKFNFNSGSYETTLELTYGHALGDYIPSPLDVMGKGVLSNNRKALGNVKSNRKKGTSHADILFLDTLFFNNFNRIDADPDATDSEMAEILKSRFLQNNRDRIKNAIVTATSKINSANKDKYFLEIRGYYYSEKNKGLLENNTYLNARDLTGWVVDEIRSLSHKESGAGGDNIDVSQIRRVITDLAADLDIVDREFHRFPSTKAWTGALNSNFDIDNIKLPVNAVELVFLIDGSRRGDNTPTSTVIKVERLKPEQG